MRCMQFHMVAERWKTNLGHGSGVSDASHTLHARIKMPWYSILHALPVQGPFVHQEATPKHGREPLVKTRFFARPVLCHLAGTLCVSSFGGLQFPHVQWIVWQVIVVAVAEFDDVLFFGGLWVA